ncbi:hypothetical protein J3R30DRAFT_2745916 [Lentinula aciculospora]|uniref:Uncharacterized protein n=1 Tax=Lentinula aciculospora TaxID=153920 RepID=A0A9W9AC19_9AGAR|nr:hypothetical protein J3R30DRAFT_2745916 [Lentinula aciculospora]
MSHSKSASRPGPLCEWPLDRFLPSSSTQVKLSGNSRPNKRPLSPGGPSLFSPTKRRILTQEGIFSPEKTMKSSFGGRSTPGISVGDLLRAPGSPAKRLDYGITSSTQPPSSILGDCEVADLTNVPRPSTPVKATSNSRSLALSPEIVSRTNAPKSMPHRTFDDDDFFATPERLPFSLSRPLPPTPFTLFSCELPPPCDPQSIHYPGFMVHRDAHTSALDLAALESLLQDSKDRDEWKENLAPKRKVKKVIADPVGGKPLLLTPEAKKLELEKLFKAKLTPATPRKTAAKEWQEVTSPTPRRTGRSKVGTPVIISEEEKKQRRRMLKDEVDKADGLEDI